MSQSVGYQYKSRVPSISDDANIVEALKVYHYGIDNWTTEPIPDDSIEGNFRTLHTDVASIQAQLSSLNYVQLISQTSSPNVVTGQSTTTVPITIRAIASQTAVLQRWQNSSSVNVGSVSTGGNMNIAGYMTVGTTTQATTTAVNVVVSSPTHKGLVVKSQPLQSANIQEWQNSSGTAVSWVDKDAKIFSNGIETATLTATQVLTNKTMDGSLNTFSNIPFSAIPGIDDEYAAKHISISEMFEITVYIPNLDDDGKMIEMNSVLGNVVIVPFNDSVAFPIGTAIVITQTGTGQTIIDGDTRFDGSFVTVNGTPGLKLRTQWSSATIIKRGINSWIAVGDLSA